MDNLSTRRETIDAATHLGYQSHALNSHQKFRDRIIRSLLKHGQGNKNATNKIEDFKTFTKKKIAKYWKQYTVYQGDKNLYLLVTGCMEPNVVHAIHFKEVKPHFGLIFLEQAEIKGFEVFRKCFLSKRTVYLENGPREPKLFWLLPHSRPVMKTS